MTLPVAGRSRSGFAVDEIVPTLVAGIVCGFLAIVFSISYGNLLLSGGMHTYAPVAIGMALFSTALGTAVAALTSSIRGVVAHVQDVPMVALAGVASLIAADLAGRATDHATIVTIIVAVALATIATGVAILLLGAFRLGSLIRFVPFPVIGGFLAGTGWLILLGGFSVILGEPVSLASLGLIANPATAWKLGLAIAFVIIVALLYSRFKSNLVLPLAIVVALVLFNLAAWASGFSGEALAEGGWLIRMPEDVNLWPPIAVGDLAEVDWGAILRETVNLPLIVVVTVVALLMNASGIEIDTSRDVDLDQELRSAGLRTLISGAGGGMPGYPSVSLSLLAVRLGAPNRAVGLVVATLSAAALFFGELVLSVVPTPLLGSLLVWIGGMLMVQWLVDSYWRLAIWEYLIILLIFLVIALVSFTYGILVGLVAATILFVVEYGRVDSVRHILTGKNYQSTFEASDERRETLRRHGDAILVIRLQGFIFFGTSDRLRKRIKDRVKAAGETSVHYLLLDFERVTGIDSSTVLSFIRLGQIAIDEGFTLVLTGMSDTVRRALVRGGLNPGDPGIRIEEDIDHGLAWCENRLLERVAPATIGVRTRGVTELVLTVIKDEALVGKLVPYLERVEVPAGAPLIEQGTPSDDIFFIESGVCAVLIGAAGDTDLRVASVGPGAIVGELAFYLGTPRSASVVADQDVVAWRLAAASLRRLEAELPTVAFRFHEGIAAMMADRLIGINRLVAFLAR